MMRRFFEELGLFLEAFRKGKKVFYALECRECRYREGCARAVQQMDGDGIWRSRWMDFCSEAEPET